MFIGRRWRRRCRWCYVAALGAHQQPLLAPLETQARDGLQPPLQRHAVLEGDGAPIYLPQLQTVVRALGHQPALA